MTQQGKSSKAELWVAIAALALMAGLVLPVVAYDIGQRMNTLRDHGVVTEARIVEKQKTQTRERVVQAGGGRVASRLIIEQTLNLSFNRYATTPFRDVEAGKSLIPGGYSRDYPYTITVGPGIYDKFKPGDTVLVAFLPDAAFFDKDSFQLFETVRAQAKTTYLIWLYLGSVALLVFGVWAGVYAWRLTKLTG